MTQYTKGYTAKLWEKNGHRRLYVNDGSESIGYWDLVREEAVITSRWKLPSYAKDIASVAAEWEADVRSRRPATAANRAIAANKMAHDVLYHHYQ